MAETSNKRFHASLDFLSIADIVAAAVCPRGVSTDADNWLGLCKAAVVDEKLTAAIGSVAHVAKQRTRLMWAAKAGKLNRVQFLCKHAASSINASEVNGQTPLIRACKFGQVDVIRHLLRCGAQVNVIDTSGKTGLFHACEGGFDAAVDVLIAHRANIDAMDPRSGGDTPLILACRKKHVSVALKLLANPDCQRFDWGNQAGQSPLVLACLHNLPALVTALLGRGANPERPCKIGSNAPRTALTIAVDAKSDKAAVALVEGGARYDTGALGGQPLVTAIKRHSLRLAMCLLQRGEVVTGQHGPEAPLRLAFESGWDVLVQALLDAGASLGPELPQDSVLLLAACRTAKFEPVVLLLLQTGVSHDVDCLVAAAGSGMLKAVSKLLSLGVSINALDDDCRAALHAAAAAGHVDLCRALVTAGANTTVRDADGCTPWLLAVKEGQLAVVQYFIECATALDAHDHDGHGAIHWAVATGNAAMLDALLAANLAVPSDDPGRLDLYTAAINSKASSDMWGRMQSLVKLPLNAACREGTELLAAALCKGPGIRSIAATLVARGADLVAAAQLIFSGPASVYKHKPHLERLPLLLQVHITAEEAAGAGASGPSTSSPKADQARRMLIKCHLNGTGVAKHMPTVVNLYRQLAESGDRDAMYDLAEVLDVGAEGVPRDRIAAGQLLLKLLDAGDTRARDKLWRACRDFTPATSLIEAPAYTRSLHTE